MKSVLITIFLISILIFSNLALANYFVIGSETAKNEQVTKIILKDIFLGKKLFWKSGERIRPTHVAVTTPSFQEFLTKVLNMDASQFLTHWRRKLFSGRGYPPKEFKKSEMIVKYIESNPESIGIIAQLPKVTPQGVLIIDIKE